MVLNLGCGSYFRSNRANRPSGFRITSNHESPRPPSPLSSARLSLLSSTATCFRHPPPPPTHPLIPFCTISSSVPPAVRLNRIPLGRLLLVGFLDEDSTRPHRLTASCVARRNARVSSAYTRPVIHDGVTTRHRQCIISAGVGGGGASAAPVDATPSHFRRLSRTNRHR